MVDCECLFELKGPVNPDRPEDLWYVTPVRVCQNHIGMSTHGGYYTALPHTLVADPLASALHEHFD